MGEPEELNDAFHPDNFGPVSLIMMMRLYDIGMALLSVHDENKAAMLAEMHEAGLTFTPAPVFAVEDDGQDLESEPEDNAPE